MGWVRVGLYRGFADVLHGGEGGVGDVLERLFEEGRMHEARGALDAEDAYVVVPYYSLAFPSGAHGLDY